MKLSLNRCAEFAMGFALIATAPCVAGMSPIFLDGFESGDMCAWQGSCPAPADVEGTWIGVLAFPGGVSRTVAVQLNQRVEGDLLGYLLGSSESWVVRAGAYTGGNLELEIVLGSPAGDRIVALAGPVSGEQATLVLTGDLANQTVELVRWSEELVESRFLFADSTGGLTTPHFVNLAVALTESGDLVAGSWSGSEQKPPWGWDGGVTSFAAAGDALTVELDLDGGCSAGSVLDATFDSSFGLYFGTFDLIDCAGSQPGTLLGGFVDGTTSADVTQVLSALGEVADQLESGVPFTSPHPSFVETYLHEGTDLAGLFAGFAAETTTWSDIEFTVLGISRIATREVPGERSILSRPLGVDFRQIRSGVPSGGGIRETYADTRTAMLALVAHNQLGIVAEDAGVWKISGDQQPAFDLPWISSAIQPGDRRLEATTPGDPIHVALGGYGAHFSPLSGHAFGDRKANFSGFLPADDSELDELVGDGVGDDDGICAPAELEDGGCAYWAATDGSLVRQRTPWYVAPQDGEVSGMKLKSGGPSDYFDSPPHWEVALSLDSGIKMELGHVGRIADDVALAVLDETGCDPRTWETCTGVGNGTDILLGASPIPVNAGDAVAQPQVFADEVPGFAGYRVGGGGNPEYPWAQMEFNVSAVVEGRLINACVFGLMGGDLRDAYKTVMEADMTDPDSQRYRTRFDWPQWAWRAEAALCNSEWQGDTDFSSLYTSLGGWYERDDAGTVSDELVAFAPIATETGLYDPGSYEPGTDTLILRQKASPGSFMWTMPDASVIEAFYPAGELLHETPSSLLVLWREEIGWGDGEVYQAAAYRLDDDGLTIKWGPFAATSAAALAAAPTLGPAEPCDETTVICYNHKEQPGYCNSHLAFLHGCHPSQSLNLAF